MKNQSKEIPGAILTDEESKKFKNIIRSIYGVSISVKKATIIGSNLIQALELIQNSIQNEISGTA